MTTTADRASAWVYRGVWGALVRLFKLPQHPPSLPTGTGQRLESFQPGPGYLRYLKFQFWVLLLLVDIVLVAGWVAITAALVSAEQYAWAGALAVPALAIIVVPDIIAYIAIHVRYDTTWYVLTDRSLRIRRGVLVLHELTITFENVQNVTVTQGPLERWFGIASVVVETAGGGASAHPQHGGTTHRGVIHGIGNAPEVRDLILSNVRASTSAGLGDERSAARAHRVATPGASAWSPRHLAALCAIRDELRAMHAPRA